MTRRVLAVAFFLLLACTAAVPDLRRALGHPLGLTGLSFNYDGVVTYVDQRASASGVRAGDRIDLRRATPDQRVGYYSLGTADAGMDLTIPMLRGNTRYVASLVTYPESGERIVMLLLRDFIQFAITLLAALVLLRRPSPATWSFFLLVYIGCSPVNVVYLVGPFWWRVVAVNFFWLVGNNVIGSYAAIIFALHLLHPGPLPRWRRVAQSVTIAVGILAVAVSLWHANAVLFAPWPDGRGTILYSILLTGPIFIAPLVLIATYFESSAEVRERLRWIITGFLLGALANAIDWTGSQGNLGLIQESYTAHSLLVSATYVFITIPVAYAVLKHHIIDVNVAISRATVYTALSVFIIGAFTLVDFFFSHAVSQDRAGLLADVGLALILGFSFNTMHRNVESFVDRLLFRQKHRAEEYVAGVADAMAYARSEEHVVSMLTNEPMRAFDLAAARIVQQSDGADEQTKTLCAYVESRHGAVRLTGGQWQFDAAAAVPVFSHGALGALILYGLHRNGTDLDADELSLLERLGTSAGAAFDRLEAQSLRQQVADLLQQTREGAIG